jgi:poly(A) polymerase
MLLKSFEFLTDTEPVIDEARSRMAENPSPFAEFLQGVDPDALKVVRRLLQAGHEAYLVGGCVRDLYLSRRPKDFDIATSATPEKIRRLFRNSRIIGRRFKLAHVFFGPKIIETSTFRTAPQSDGSDDPLITHDNEWGSVEDDARRRDFTINGLFFDVESERIVDFVDGMDDLDGRLIRTIGDPELRFREDPVRMIRAIKFAARLDFSFDPATWQALLDVSDDIAKCSKARLLEEIYKLLRGGASRRSFELLLEAGLLQSILEPYIELYGPDGAEQLLEARQGHDPADRNAQAVALQSPAQLFWRYLRSLDEYTTATQQVASNGVLQAVLFAPLLHTEIAGGSRQNLDRHIDDLMNPVGNDLGLARRDRELARQILMAHRRMVETSPRRRRRVSLAQRQYFHDALIFLGIAVGATGDDGSELDQWMQLARAQHVGGGGGDRPAKAEVGGPKRRRRRSGGKKRGRSGPRPSDRAVD